MLTKENRLVKDRLIVALDVPSVDDARALVKELKDHVGMFKIGLELYANAGLSLFEMMRAEGIKLFFDGKFHDIPNTTAQASRGITKQGVAMFNLHAMGGSHMMKAAAEACQEATKEAKLKEKPYLIAVTVLTSLEASTLKNELHISEDIPTYVGRMARLVQKAGLDGVVASAQEAKSIRRSCGDDFLIVTPGIRPAWSSNDDQKRIVTPAKALKAGADYLVMGRPITGAKNKKDAVKKVLEEMESAL